MGLLTHIDSPYIRALEFMYTRYTQIYRTSLNSSLMRKKYVNKIASCEGWCNDHWRNAAVFSHKTGAVYYVISKNLCSSSEENQQIKIQLRKFEKDENEGTEEIDRHFGHRYSQPPRRSLSPQRSPRRWRSRSHYQEGHECSSFDQELEKEKKCQ